MDLIKIGKFIALKRNEKGLTQEQLADRLGITGKSVSKWERGVNMPDIEKLEQLCDVLDITIAELLNGKKSDFTFNDLNNKSFLEVVKYYFKNFKKMYIYVLFLLLFICCFFTLATFMFNNFNKNQIYTIRSLDEQYEINGYLILNQDRNLFIMNDLNFQGDVVGTPNEPRLKLINIFITYDDKNLMSYTENVDDNKSNQLSSVLDSLSFSIDDDKQSNSSIINYKSDFSKIKLKIEYLTIDDKTDSIEVDMDFEKIFSNNKIVY